MIWIIGGTSETIEFIEKIEGKVDYIVTVATYAGMERLKGKNVAVKRLDSLEMTVFIKTHKINKIIDLTHPYAVEVSENAKCVAKDTNTEYIRYVRGKSKIYSDIISVDGIDECIEVLKKIKGNVFFTTGSKNIKDFEKVKRDNRFIYRVLPSKFSIEECIENNVELKDIVAVLGPFSVELNMSLFREYSVDYVVMKDSGIRGGTDEKLVACNNMNIGVIMIKREDERGIDDIDELVELIL